MEESSDDRYAALDAFAFSSDAEEQAAPDRTAKDDESLLKKCSICKAYKPLTGYYKNASKCDGLQTMCKVCTAATDSHRVRRPKRREGDDDEETHEPPKQGSDEEPPQKRSRGDDLYVFKNSRLPEYKIGRSSDIAARSHGLQKSQNFYMQKVAIFEGEGHLEDSVREMLAYCLLPREVAAGTEWHACSLQTALAAIGQAIDSENAQH